MFAGFLHSYTAQGPKHETVPPGVRVGALNISIKTAPTDMLTSQHDPDSPSLRLSSKVRLTVKADYCTSPEAWGIHNLSEAKFQGPGSVTLSHGL